MSNRRDFLLRSAYLVGASVAAPAYLTDVVFAQSTVGVGLGAWPLADIPSCTAECPLSGQSGKIPLL